MDTAGDKDSMVLMEQTTPHHVSSSYIAAPTENIPFSSIETTNKYFFHNIETKTTALILPSSCMFFTNLNVSNMCRDHCSGI